MLSMNVTLSGLNAASKRIENASNNIANISSTRTNRNGDVTVEPYVPKDIVQISQENGGVRAEAVDTSNPVIKQFNPESPDADENGFVNMPNVDLAEELVNIQIATYDFKANLKVLEAQDSLAKSTLDILS